MSEEHAEQAKILEVDVASLKQKYKQMLTWKQTHGNKMNFQKFKEYTDAQKLNQELKRRAHELGLDSGPQETPKLLPIEIELEKRKRKEPSKYDESKKANVML